MKRTLSIIAAVVVVVIAVVFILAKRHAAKEADLAMKAQLEADTARSWIQASASQSQRGRRELKDPVARQALSLVGVDPVAEEVWILAINNPEIPKNERQDLIEDLNEEGLRDKRNPAADELPLIQNRIKIVEELMPFAMDSVNADAFREAHKDLVNMRNRLQR